MILLKTGWRRMLTGSRGMMQLMCTVLTGRRRLAGTGLALAFCSAECDANGWSCNHKFR